MRRSAAAGAVLAAGAALLWPLAGPASAADVPGVTVATAVSGGRATVSGSAQMANFLNQLTALHVGVTSHLHPATTASCDGTGCGATLNRSSTSYSFTTPDLAYNGPYDVTVTATGQTLLDGPQDGSATGTFGVEVPPAPPADVKATVNPDRTVTVSWSRNTEPDLVGYQVQRRPVGGSSFTAVSGAIAQPASGTTLSYTDQSTAAAGGTFEYVVLAVRPDASGHVSDRATARSARSAGASVSPPDGPNPTSGLTTPAGPAPGVAGAAPGKGLASLDLGSFLSKATSSAPPKVSLPTVPDNGFVSTLPLRVPGAADSTSGSNDSAVVGVLRDASDRRALMVPVAAGLILCLAAFHLRWFNRRMGATVAMAYGGEPLDPAADADPTVAMALVAGRGPTGPPNRVVAAGRPRLRSAPVPPPPATEADDDLWRPPPGAPSPSRPRRPSGASSSSRASRASAASSTSAPSRTAPSRPYDGVAAGDVAAGDRLERRAMALVGGPEAGNRGSASPPR
ncbi:MAG: hypothetical protein ABR511_10195 [Acidimicrobiales bacterium]